MADLEAAINDAPSVTNTEQSAPPEPSSRLDGIREIVAQQLEDKGASDKAADIRARAPDGKFAPAIDKPAQDRTPRAPNGTASPQPLASSAAPVAAALDAQPGSDAAPAVRPPPGWSPASKVAFDTLPESVKADIAKRELEVNKGFEKLSSYKGIDKYVDMAKQSGTTIDKALENYVGLEQLLRRDVFAGIDQVLINSGVQPRAFFQAWLQRNGGQQSAQPAPQARQQAFDPRQLVDQTRAAIRSEMEQERLVESVKAFAADPANRFFENVKPDMARLADVYPNRSIKELYDMACRSDPEISKLINQTSVSNPAAVRASAVNQARAAGRATVGAPASGQAPTRTPPSNQSRRDVIRDAVAAQRGGRA